MNAEPHAHVVRLRRTYDYHNPACDSGAYLVEYGDQKVRYAWVWQRPERWSSKRLERKVKRATALAVSRHDAASVQAGKERAKRDAALRVAEAAAREVSSEWAHP